MIAQRQPFSFVASCTAIQIPMQLGGEVYRKVLSWCGTTSPPMWGCWDIRGEGAQAAGGEALENWSCWCHQQGLALHLLRPQVEREAGVQELLLQRLCV